MAENSASVVSRVAPIIRGLTFDGTVGRAVVFTPEEEAGREGSAADSVVDLSSFAGSEHGGPAGEQAADDPAAAGRAPEDPAAAGRAWAGALAAALSEFASSADASSSNASSTDASSAGQPKRLRVPGVGIFAIGRDIDEARGIAPLPGEPVAGPKAGPKSGRMAGRICVVTGGAQGFGEELVRRLVAEGATVAVADLQIEGAKRLASELNGRAGRTVAFGVQVDVSEERSVKAMIETVVGTAGGMDLVVSNAGVLVAGSVKELTREQFRFVTSVNYDGFFLITKHASPVMARQYHGAKSAAQANALTAVNGSPEGVSHTEHTPDSDYLSDIVQINSKSGLVGSNRNGAYAGSKFGSIGLVQSFALELIDDGIKVNAICPGNFFDGPLWSDPHKGLFVQYLNAGKVPGAKTVDDVKRHYESRVPMGRGCRGEDVARALFYIVDQEYETGQALPVTGGQVMLH